IATQIKDFAPSLFGSLGSNISIIEILFLCTVLFFFHRKFIKGTVSESLVRGIFGLLIIWVAAEFLIWIDLQIIGVFLKALVSVVAFGLIVIFQPELRRFLSYIGQGNWFSKIFLSKKPQRSTHGKDIIKELIETIKYLSKWKIGGLIVLHRDESALSYSDVGTKINADISQELLLTIFQPKTPLHDGAVVIANDKILAAGVLLPLTEDPKLSWRYGTRHRAAIGVSEICDCACIVISEETGDVSIAIDGKLKKYEDLGQLRADLERILTVEDEEDSTKPGPLSSFKFDKKFFK
ncbi:diadenylate cyclase family, partial [Candidatus Gastranaerophilus sp. (ex Termes propinquus)]